MKLIMLHYLACIVFAIGLSGVALSYPASTPLNERRREISWEAWLLVDDDQNQSGKQNQEGGAGPLPKRRITPKSVFVAPTFSPDSLPPCAEGYSSDSMGRCIKIIKLDEDKHLEFLVSKLNDKFGVIDYEEDFEEVDAEPFQLNIPLGLEGGDYSSDTPREEPDIAIIVTPTANKETDDDDDDSKVGKRHDNLTQQLMYEEELKKLWKTTRRYADEATATASAESETTTSASTVEADTTTYAMGRGDDEETTTTRTTTVVVDNEDGEEETTTTTTTATSGDVSKEAATSTTMDGFESTTLTSISETPITASTSTTPKITTYHPKATTYHPPFDMSSLLLPNPKTKNLIRFPEEEEEEEEESPRSHPDGNYIRFPDADAKYQQESLVHHTRDVNDHYVTNEVVTVEPSNRIQEVVLPPHGYYKNYHHHQRGGAAGAKKAHRGSLFLLPPKWSEKGAHKPLVLRFSRKHFSLDSGTFKSNEFYRSMPMEDVSYLFGYKMARTDDR